MLAIACAAIISLLCAYLLWRGAATDRAFWVPFLLLALLLVLASVPASEFAAAPAVLCVGAAVLPLALCIAACYHSRGAERALFAALSAISGCALLYIVLSVCHAAPGPALARALWAFSFCLLALVAAFFGICTRRAEPLLFAASALCIAATTPGSDAFPVLACVGPFAVCLGAFVSVPRGKKNACKV